MSKKEIRAKIYELFKKETGSYPSYDFRKELKGLLKDHCELPEKLQLKPAESGWRQVKGHYKLN